MSEANADKFYCPHCVVEVSSNPCPTCGNKTFPVSALKDVINSAAKLHRATTLATSSVDANGEPYRLRTLREAFLKMNAKRKRQYFVWYDNTLRASVWTDLDNPSVEQLIALAIDAVDEEGTRSWYVHAVAKLDRSKITIELADKLLANELISKDLADLNL